MVQKGSTFKKKPSIEKVCVDCSRTFLARDIKTLRCPDCVRARKTCECGNTKSERAQYCHTCRQTKYSHTRGKTYEQILGKERAADLRARKAFTQTVSRSKRYRSRYEQLFATWLQENNILFHYEPVLRGIEDTWSKYVDFFLPQQKMYVELSGYIWASNRLQLQNKFVGRLVEIASLLSDYEVVVATEPSLLERVQAGFDGYYTYPANTAIQVFTDYQLREYIKQKELRK